jgi:hypothetical protein
MVDSYKGLCLEIDEENDNVNLLIKDNKYIKYDMTGIYFLVTKNNVKNKYNVLYVGQSGISINSRLNDHYNSFINGDFKCWLTEFGSDINEIYYIYFQSDFPIQNELLFIDIKFVEIYFPLNKQYNRIDKTDKYNKIISYKNINYDDYIIKFSIIKDNLEEYNKNLDNSGYNFRNNIFKNIIL